MKTLYPEITPFRSFFLDTDSPHRVYVEQSGNPHGMPVVFLHGGPCSGTKPDHRRFFDPQHYHIILLDQRGCGQSLPFGELAGNTTQDLIADLERIRAALHIEQWLIFGGSWGGALALLYAQQHPQTVAGLIIRGVFLARQRDFDWFIAPNGVGRIYPQAWHDLQATLPPQWAGDLLHGLYAAVFDGATETQLRAARQWMTWGAQVTLGPDYQPALTTNLSPEQTIKQVQMELHYARNRYFICENQILTQCPSLIDIPTIIIHGQNDLVCPPEAGWSLHRTLPQAEYLVLPNAGHAARGAEMIDALVSATDTMRQLSH